MIIALLIPIVLLLIITILSVTVNKRSDNDNFIGGLSIVGIVLFSIIFIANIIGNFCSYYNRTNELSIIATNVSQIQIKEKQRNDILLRLQDQLVAYNIYEKSTYKELKIEEVNFLFQQYPNLRSIEVVKKLIENIESLSKQIYALESKTIEAKRRIIRSNALFYRIYKVEIQL